MADNKVIDPQMQEMWDNELRQYGVKVLPETAMFYEMETFFPSYAFVVLDQKFTQGRITFFFRDDKPYNPDDEELHWYEIEAQYVKAALARVKELEIRPEVRFDVEGYVVPLQENSFFGSWEDISTYLHNLMYWESVMSADENGPLTQRMTWLSQTLYTMKGNEKRAYHSSMMDRPYAKIVEELMTKRSSDEVELRSFMERLMVQIQDEERMNDESRMRQTQLQQQIRELQDRLDSERVLNEYRRKNSNTILEQLRKYF